MQVILEIDFDPAADADAEEAVTWLAEVMEGYANHVRAWLGSAETEDGEMRLVYETEGEGVPPEKAPEPLSAEAAARVNLSRFAPSGGEEGAPGDA